MTNHDLWLSPLPATFTANECAKLWGVTPIVARGRIGTLKRARRIETLTPAISNGFGTTSAVYGRKL